MFASTKAIATRLLGFTALLLATPSFLGTTAAAAKVEVPFSTQFSTSARGGVAAAGNTLMTCPDSGGTETKCLESRAGTATGAALNNNAYKMERVDVDADPATFDSSTARLLIPTGATVEFAGLYYGARTTRGTGGEAASNPAARGKVLLRVPDALAYSELSAAVADSAAISGAYAAFVDVTAQVAAAGSGDYTVANVQAGTGEDRYAGWSLVVVYSDPASPPRSIRVFNGLASIVANEAPLQIAVPGLETPPTGTVTAEVGVVAYEGDLGAVGDRLSLAGRNLSDAANPANNVFNSSIAVDGVNVTAKSPDYVNQLGFDSDLIKADGFLANGLKETTLEESTSLDQYLTQTIVVAVELDPAALEPPAPEKKSEESHEKSGSEHDHHGEADHQSNGEKSSGERAASKVGLDVSAPAGTVRPRAVVPFEASIVAPADRPIEDLQVCNTIGPGLTRLRAPGASRNGAAVCWYLSELPRGKRRTFTTTVRVDATSRRTLSSRTVVRARGAHTVRRVTRIHVVPLPNRACGSSLSAAGAGVLPRRC